MVITVVEEEKEEEEEEEEGVQSQLWREECLKMEGTRGPRQITLFESPEPPEYFHYSKIWLKSAPKSV